MSYANFSSWPLNDRTNDGVNVVVSPRDMKASVNPQIQEKQIFRFGGLFADDCRFGCGDMPSKLSATGSGRITGKDVLNLFSSGLTYYSDSQKAQADKEAAERAAEIARLQLAAERQRTEQAGIMSKYKVPIAIGVAVVLAGVAAYFVYKTKKKA